MNDQFSQPPVTDLPVDDAGEVDVEAVADDDADTPPAVIGDTFDELEHADGGGGSGGAPLGSRRNPRPR